MKKAAIISAIVFSVALPSMGMSAAHATTIPQALDHVNTEVTATANANVGRVASTTIRTKKNTIRTKYVSNSNRILVKYKIDGRWVSRIHKMTNNTIVVFYPARVTQILVRTLTDSKGRASNWTKVKISQKQAITPTPVVPKPTPLDIVNINTCEQYDDFVTSYGVSPENKAEMAKLRNGPMRTDVKNVVNYGKSCKRDDWWTSTINPIISLGKPQIASCSVVPLNDAPAGWTVSQIKSRYQYDKKGWLVEVVYPVVGEQKFLDTDVYWPGNDSPEHPWGKKDYTGTYRWLTAKNYIPANYGDTITYNTQSVGSTATVNGGDWVWGNTETGVTPKFIAKVAYPTQKVNSLNAGSTVRITKFVPATNGNIADLNAQILVTVTSGATAYHGAKYLPDTVIEAETLGYNPTRMNELFFNQSRLDEPGYGGEYVHRDSVGGEEKAYQVNLDNMCK